MKAATKILPIWARVLVMALAAVIIFLLGRADGERRGWERHEKYLEQQAQSSQQITEGLGKVVVKTEVVYRDRIQKVYVKGKEIIKEVPVYVTSSDDAACTVNTGFVRTFNAAWAGEPAGPVADSDREPSGIPLSEVAATDAHNAAACLAWREQALGWREFYEQAKAVVNGSAEKREE